MLLFTQLAWLMIDSLARHKELAHNVILCVFTKRDRTINILYTEHWHVLESIFYISQLGKHAHKGQMTCLKPQSQETAKLGFILVIWVKSNKSKSNKDEWCEVNPSSVNCMHYFQRVLGNPCLRITQVLVKTYSFRTFHMERIRHSSSDYQKSTF